MAIVPTRVRNLCIKIRNSEEGEIVYEKGAGWWVDSDRVFAPDANDLLGLVLIRKLDEGTTIIERYTLNEDGRALAADPNYRPEILKHM